MGSPIIVLFGDPAGIPQVLRVLLPGLFSALVGAETRPDQHEELRSLARKYGLPLLIQPRPDAPAYPAFEQQLRALVPDLILVNSYSMRLESELLAIPRLGAVNIHGGLLPEYRGSNPIQWVLLNNGTETGVTMHYMVAKFDAGDIIAQRRVPVYFEDTWRDVQARLGAAAETMLAEEVPKLLAGASTRQPQDGLRARYFRRRKPEDGQIDWRQSVLSIYNLVRALVKPHPGAFYYTGSRKVVLDEYLTIPKVTALKYHPMEGGQRLAARHVELVPPLDGNQQRNDAVVFGIRRVGAERLIGACHLDNIDYVGCHGKALVWFEEPPEGADDLVPEAVRLLLGFAFEELNLERVDVCEADAVEAILRACEKIGFVTDQGVSGAVMRIRRYEYAGR